MYRRPAFPLIGLLLLNIAATTVFAQGPSVGTIIGIARVLRGTFPEPVLVSLQLRGATVDTAYTDSEGRFSFHNLASNPYRVVVDNESYDPVSIEVNVRPDLIPISFIQLTLVPRMGKAGPKASGPYVVSSSDFSTYPKKAVKEFERGMKLESEGKADEAIESYRKAIKVAPDFAVAHNNLGSVYMSKSQFPEAKQELEQSIRLAPSDSKAFFNMANLMLLTGKLDEAESYLQKGFRLHPESPFGFFVQGSVLERTGKLPEAERALQHALQLDPKMTHPRLELVNVYLREQRPTDAMSELNRFLQVAPNDPLAPQARGVLEKLQAVTSKSPRK